MFNCSNSCWLQFYIMEGILVVNIYICIHNSYFPVIAHAVIISL